MKPQNNSLENSIDILVVEDSQTQSQKLKYLLESHKFNVRLANDGKHALALIEEQKPALVLTDVVMPEMNGYDLCREIKAKESLLNIPVILLTSLTNPDDVLEGLACGADNFITKPFGDDYLISHIEQILANRKLVKVERVRIGVEIVFGGKRRFITADQQQMLSLLLSTYEAASRRNAELIKTQEELRTLNDHLEELVEDRTSELQNQRDFAETLINTAQTAILLLDPQGKILHFNPYFEELSGYHLEEVRGQSWFSTFLPEIDRKQVENLFAKAVAGAQTKGNINAIVCKNGSQRQIEWFDKTIMSKDGKIISLLAIGQDITEHRKREQHIEHLNQVLRAVRNVNQLIVREKNPAKLIQEACQILVKFRGYRGVWIILSNETERLMKWSHAGFVKDVSEMEKMLNLKKIPSCCEDSRFKGGMNQIFERQKACEYCPFGTLKSGNECMCLQLGHGNKIYGYLGVMVEHSFGINDEEQSLLLEMAGDVAFALYSIEQSIEMEKNEEARFQLEAQLRQSQKMEAIGQLAGGVAHDFNNMLQIINSSSELAMMAMDSSNPIYGNLKEIFAAGEHSANLTRQLLAFARKQSIVPQVLDINEVTSSILKMLKRLIRENITLCLTPSDYKCPVNMDPAQIDQILANLIVNARDAISGEGAIVIKTCKVDFSPSEVVLSPDCFPGQFIQLSVSDSGCGMSAETRERIFEPFFTTKESGKGTGLGLATVYGIVKQNNGFIRVESQPGKGTTFKIYLPIFNQEIPIIEEGQPIEARQAVEAAMKGGKTILIVDDELAVLSICALRLESMGYKVLTAERPDLAIQIVKDYQGDINLLLTDVIMPEMSGRDLWQCIYALRPEMKCIFMSGYTSDAIAKSGMIETGIHFLQKPFSEAALANKILEAFSSN